MGAALASSLVDVLLGSLQGPAGQEAGNRVAFEGLTLATRDGGALEIGIRRLEAASLRVASGPLALQVGQLALDQLVATLHPAAGGQAAFTLQAASAELSNLTVQGPLAVLLPPADAGVATPWSLDPLASAEGTVRAQIVDAHLLFDAKVTVPLHQGQIEFKDATVEHVGPDSRMGVSRLGLYVDAPDGRSYVYQFPSSPVAGVAYEQRGALLGPWVTDRGSLRLQPFVEWLLRQPAGALARGVTDQARPLVDRTAVSGDVQLGDGRIAAAGVQTDLAGGAEGRNAVRLHSPAVGHGLTVELASLLVRDTVLGAGATRIDCAQAGGALTLHLAFDGAQSRFSLELPTLKAAGVRLLRPSP